MRAGYRRAHYNRRVRQSVLPLFVWSFLMLRCLACGLLSLFLVEVPAFAQIVPSPQIASPAAAAAASLKELAADLKEARDLAKKVTDRTTRDRLELLITRSELKVLELEKAFAGTSGGTSSPPITAENFAKLLKGLDAESFDDDKASFVATFAVHGRLTSEQARQLLKQFSFDEGRVKSAALLYPRVTDPENFFTVLDVFTFDSSRSELRKRLNLKK
jgi:hypothetical protein